VAAVVAAAQAVARSAGKTALSRPQAERKGRREAPLFFAPEKRGRTRTDSCIRGDGSIFPMLGPGVGPVSPENKSVPFHAVPSGRLRGRLGACRHAY